METPALLVAAALATMSADPPVAFRHDFRQGRRHQQLVEYFPGQVRAMLRFAPDGLVIESPNVAVGTDAPQPLGGVATTFGVEGDFEITAGFVLGDGKTARTDAGGAARCGAPPDTVIVIRLSWAVTPRCGGADTAGARRPTPPPTPATSK